MYTYLLIFRKFYNKNITKLRIIFWIMIYLSNKDNLILAVNYFQIPFAKLTHKTTETSESNLVRWRQKVEVFYPESTFIPIRISIPLLELILYFKECLESLPDEMSSVKKRTIKRMGLRISLAEVFLLSYFTVTVLR